MFQMEYARSQIYTAYGMEGDRNHSRSVRGAPFYFWIKIKAGFQTELVHMNVQSHSHEYGFEISVP